VYGGLPEGTGAALRVPSARLKVKVPRRRRLRAVSAAERTAAAAESEWGRVSAARGTSARAAPSPPVVYTYITRPEPNDVRFALPTAVQTASG